MNRLNLNRALPGLFIACLLVAAAISSASVTPALAQGFRSSQGEPGVKPQAPTANDPLTGGFRPVVKLAAQGYQVAGPMQVTEFTGDSLSLHTGGKKQLVFSLTGKDLTVFDKDSNKITSAAITKGNHVYVCQKDKAVVVYVMPEKSKTTLGGEANGKH